MAMRVLVVDDAPDMVTLLRLALQLDGYAVDTASTGALALEVVRVLLRRSGRQAA